MKSGTKSDLAGLPVIYTPEDMDIWNSEDETISRIRAELENMVRGVRRDEREGLVLPGGFSTSQVAIRNNVTKLRDVVLSARILNMSAMNDSQAQTLVYTVNDVESNLDDTLNIGDVIRMSARKAGDKGK